MTSAASDLDVCAKLVRIAHRHVAREFTRYQLQGVHIAPHPVGGVYIVATNGWGMLVLHDPEGHAARPVTVRLGKPFRRAIRRRGKLRLVMDLPADRATRNDATLVLRRFVDEPDDRIAIQPQAEIDADYPDWHVAPVRLREVMGADASTSDVPGFNPSFVRPFLRSAVALRKLSGSLEHDDVSIRIVGTGAQSPALIAFGPSIAGFGVLMPRKLYAAAAAALPGWYAAPLAQMKPDTEPTTATQPDAEPEPKTDRRTMSRDALGLPNPSGCSRTNSYSFGQGSPADREWSAMAAEGLARRVWTVSSSGFGSLQTYELTRAGAEQVLEAGERLDPDCFPPITQD